MEEKLAVVVNVTSCLLIILIPFGTTYYCVNFKLGIICIIEDLGFVKFITNAIGPQVPTMLIPVVIFLIGCAASYFMGSAWGTWALLMPIAISLGQTAILSSTISEVPLMKHIKTLLPYSIISIII